MQPTYIPYVCKIKIQLLQTTKAKVRGGTYLSYYVMVIKTDISGPTVWYSPSEQGQLQPAG